MKKTMDTDFKFLFICLIVVIFFSLGIICGGTIAERAAKQLYVGAIHESPGEER